VRAFHAPKIGTTVRALVQGPSRKDRSKLAAKTIDNVTIIAPAGALGEAEVWERPWLDVRIDEAFTWGCAGEVVRIAARYDDASPVAVARPTIDLVSAR